MLQLLLIALLCLARTVYGDPVPMSFTFFVHKSKVKDKNKSKYLLIKCNKSLFYFDLQKDEGFHLDDSTCIPVVIRCADQKDISEFRPDPALGHNIDGISTEIDGLSTMFPVHESSGFALSCYPLLKAALSSYLNTLGKYEVRLTNEPDNTDHNKPSEISKLVSYIHYLVNKIGFNKNNTPTGSINKQNDPTDKSGTSDVNQVTPSTDVSKTDKDITQVPVKPTIPSELKTLSSPTSTQSQPDQPITNHVKPSNTQETQQKKNETPAQSTNQIMGNIKLFPLNSKHKTNPNANLTLFSLGNPRSNNPSLKTANSPSNPSFKASNSPSVKTNDQNSRLSLFSLSNKKNTNLKPTLFPVGSKRK